MDDRTDPPAPRRVNESVGFVPTIAVASFVNLLVLGAFVVGAVTGARWTGGALAVCVLLAVVLIRLGLRETKRVTRALVTLCRVCVFLNSCVLAAWLIATLSSLVGVGS
jgi:hypothetical protein